MNKIFAGIALLVLNTSSYAFGGFSDRNAFVGVDVPYCALANNPSGQANKPQYTPSYNLVPDTTTYGTERAKPLPVSASNCQQSGNQ
jgi:hypothetical protein